VTVEKKLRQAEQIERDYERWQREHVGVVTEADRQEILRLGENLPRVWQAARTTAAERKQIVRLVIQEVTLDQKRQRGQVWIRITWQTGAVNEHWLRRRVQDYRQYAEREQLEQRVRNSMPHRKWMPRLPLSSMQKAFVRRKEDPFTGHSSFSYANNGRSPR
jgi:hypothetical protein